MFWISVLAGTLVFYLIILILKRKQLRIVYHVVMVVLGKKPSCSTEVAEQAAAFVARFSFLLAHLQDTVDDVELKFLDKAIEGLQRKSKKKWRVVFHDSPDGTKGFKVEGRATWEGLRQIIGINWRHSGYIELWDPETDQWNYVDSFDFQIHDEEEENNG